MSIDHEVHFISQGDGPPVVLIHGLASSWRDWIYLMPELASRGFAAYALDLLGHGDSAKPDDPDQYHIEHIYRHLEGWLDRLGFAGPLVLVGHSLGGYLSLLTAIRNPSRVRRMVLIDPFYEKSQLSFVIHLLSLQPEWVEKAVRVTPPGLVTRAIRWHPNLALHAAPEIRQQMAADYLRTSPYFAYLTRGLPDLSDSLAQVTAPTLILWGERDQTLHPASFPRLVNLITTASGRPIPGANHHPHLSQPDLINRLTVEFIQESA